MDGTRQKRRFALMIALLMLLGVTWFSVGIGTTDGQPQLSLDWPWTLWGAAPDSLRDILWLLRLPRCVAAILTGAALAVSGLLLQGVTRNPLADPFLLGVSGGAGLAMVLVSAFPGVAEQMGWWVFPVAAFAGAQCATLLVLFLARGTCGRISVMGLVLSGVIINAFCAACITFLVLRFEPLRLKVTSLWLAGGVGYFEWPVLLSTALVIGLTLVAVQLQASRLNAFSLGEEGASLVGVDASRVLLRATWLASLLSGMAVFLAGLVGYVGLLVPHVVRLLVGRDFRHTLMLSAAVGALVLLLGDTAARTILAPEEVPVGVLAALIGTPLLLLLLVRELRR